MNNIIEKLNLKSFGAKGWMNSGDLYCPSCGKSGEKIGVKFSGNSGVVHCFWCDTSFNLFSYLKKIGRTDLIQSKNSDFSYKDKLESFLSIGEVENLSTDNPEIKLPIGYYSIDNHPYLQERGFTKEQYKQFLVGQSNYPTFRNRIIFLIKEENKVVGYLSRSIFSKEWHKKNLQDFKSGKGDLVLRYKNSETSFENVVGGIDEVVEGETKTVILVEGIMDKANTDRVLELNKSSDIKCCYTFGCNISLKQAYKLFTKGVETIILMYDYGFIQQIQSASLKLSRFFNIFISETHPERDPGEMELDDFEKSLHNMQNAILYFNNKISTPTLKL